AAVIVTRTEKALDMVPQPVHVAGSALATDTLAVHDRSNPLWLGATALSAQKALEMAGLTVADVDLFELHDSFTIMAALSLEAAGFAEPGTGWQLARDGQI